MYVFHFHLTLEFVFWNLHIFNSEFPISYIKMNLIMLLQISLYLLFLLFSFFFFASNYDRGHITNFFCYMFYTLLSWLMVIFAIFVSSNSSHNIKKLKKQSFRQCNLHTIKSLWFKIWMCTAKETYSLFWLRSAHGLLRTHEG